jgi:hypothetical protein
LFSFPVVFSVPSFSSLSSLVFFSSSNWQFIAQGRKTWYTVSPNSSINYVSTFDVKKHDSHNKAPDMNSLSMLHDVYNATIGAGDFISVPIFWPHVGFFDYLFDFRVHLLPSVFYSFITLFNVAHWLLFFLFFYYRLLKRLKNH